MEVLPLVRLRRFIQASSHPHPELSQGKKTLTFWPDRIGEYNYYYFKTHYLQAFAWNQLRKLLKKIKILYLVWPGFGRPSSNVLEIPIGTDNFFSSLPFKTKAAARNLAPGDKHWLRFLSLSSKITDTPEGGVRPAVGTARECWALMSVQVSNFTCLGSVSTGPHSLPSRICYICLLEGPALFPRNLSDLGTSGCKSRRGGKASFRWSRKGARISISLRFSGPELEAPRQG